MQQESNNPSNNQGGMKQNSNQNTNEQCSDRQQSTTDPVFNANGQSTPRNPYYASFSNNTPQFDRQSFGNPTMNNPYISTQNPLQTSLQDPVLQNATAIQPLPDNTSATADFIKGALIGAAVTYLLNNEKVQTAAFKAVAKTSTMFQAGMEEVKERYEDARAEVAAHNIND